MDDSNYENSEDILNSPKPEKSNFTHSLIAVAVMMVAGFIHLLQWDRHFISIVPLKLAQTFHVASSESLKEIADICIERRKYECAEDALSQLVEKTESIDHLIQLGDLRRRMGFFETAINAYRAAAEAESKHATNSQKADTYFGLARCFDSLLNVDEASKYYEMALAEKPDIFQVTVTESYVEMLKKHNHLDRAKKIIQEARRRTGSQNTLARLEIKDKKPN